MQDDLSYLRTGLERIINDDPMLAEEIQDSHSDLSNELARSTRDGFESLEAPHAATDRDELLAGLETIVKTKGRPVLTVRANDYVFETNDASSDVWRSRLSDARDALRKAIPAVGRVEVGNNPDYSWVGTAWLLHEEIAITNRHVAVEFAMKRDGEFVFKLDPGFDDPMKSNIDFLQEAGSKKKRLFKVTKVLYIEPDSGPDIAFLKVERQASGDKLSPPLKLSDEPIGKGRFVAAIGYPARDSRVPDQSLVTRIFGDIYDKKRLAPGAIRSSSEQLLTHDASTLGGNSGSVLIDLLTGCAVGLHRAGLYLQDNYAVPAALIRDRLNRVHDYGTFPRTARTTSKPKPDALIREQSLQILQGTAAHSWTIPLQITVTIGQPMPHSTDASAPAFATPSAGSLQEAIASLKKQLDGHERVVNVRAGYVFENGWITDQRAVVVAVNAAVDGLPESIAGIPVRVTPASPWDLPEVRALETMLERVPTTHYVPPTDVRLTEVDEAMRVICHASPDAGWPTLATFLGGKISRLTLGIYDFTAPHVIEAIKSAVKSEPSKFNLIIQHGAAMEGDAKADDVADEKVVQKFARALGSRFKHAWASVSGPNRLFASAYHIKVAVRDGKSFWLSSGNLQSSNQPDIDPVGDNETTFGPLRSFNREWHVVVENEKLAKQYEKFLQWDLKQASALEEEEALPQAFPMVLVPAEILAREAPEVEARARAKYFAPVTVERRVRVMPLLSPDNFHEKILELLRGARNSILFQNQSLSSLGENNEPRFHELLDTLREKQEELDDVRIILRGDFNPSIVLEKLKDFGFDTSGDAVRFQRKCHTKGIIVDSECVVVGSHNWTNQGVLVNRDASLIFYEREIAEYYQRLFEFDWAHLARARVDEELIPLELAEPGQETPVGMIKMSLADLLYGDG